MKTKSSKKSKKIRLFLPLFWKFSVAIFLIVIIFGSINAYLTYTNVYYSLQNESQDKGLLLAKILASESINYLLYEDYVNLQSLIDQTASLDPSIIYIVILNEKKYPVLHTFESKIPGDLLTHLERWAADSIRVNIFSVKNDPDSYIRNISVPIFEGKLGTIQVGIAEKRLLRAVRKTVNVFWLMVALFMSVGILGALGFSHFITNPIKKIQTTASQMDFSALQERSLKKIKIRQKFLNIFPNIFRAYDELDLLVQNINDMIERLENAYSDLRKANEKLIQSEKMASIGEITSGLAHEINNPIAGIHYCIKRARTNLDSREKVEKYLDLIDDAIGRIEKVVKELLDFSRKKDIKIELVNVKSVIESALLLVAYKLEKFQISIKNNIDSKIPEVYAAKDRLTQVIINIILNSIDAIEEKMEIMDESYYKGSLSFDYEINPSYVILKITDNGIGIEEEYLNKVFDPFFTTKSVGKGTGLGLAVSFNMLQAMNGKIKMTSKKGEGTTVFIYLQREKEKK